MTNPSVTYTFTNSTASDAGQVNQNFTDIINAMTDGTKSFSIDALTCAGAATFNGDVTLGNATSDTITATGTWATASSKATSTNTTGLLDISAGSTGQLATATTPGLMNYYVTGTYQAVISGCESSGAAVTVGYTRIGNIVTVTLPEIGSAAVDAASALIFAATNNPSGIRPSSPVRSIIRVAHNSAWVSGMVYFETNGQIFVYLNAAGDNFTTNNYALSKTSISFSVA